MRHRIVLQRATEARDTFGQPIPTWTTLAEVWAAVEWQGGAEAFQGDRDYAEVPSTVTIRRSSDVMSLREKDRALVPNGAVTTLREVLATTADTSVVIEKDVVPPDGEFVVRIGSELCAVTSTATTTLTVTRGAFGTTAVRHYPGASVIVLAPCDIVAVRAGKYDMSLSVVRSEVRLTT